MGRGLSVGSGIPSRQGEAAEAYELLTNFADSQFLGERMTRYVQSMDGGPATYAVESFWQLYR